MHLEPLISEEELQLKLDELAERIRADIGEEPVILVGILKGSTYFLADLSRRLGDNVTIDFAQVKSYNGKSSTGVVKILKDLDMNIEDRNVVIVEDIVDTGLTLTYLRKLWSTRKPRSLRVVCLLSKPAARQHHTTIEYLGFEIPDEFVVGYGLDYSERFRNLPYIATLHL